MSPVCSERVNTLLGKWYVKYFDVGKVHYYNLKMPLMQHKHNFDNRGECFLNHRLPGYALQISGGLWVTLLEPKVVKMSVSFR